MRKLRIWNGRILSCGEFPRGGHLYICAYSQKDAVALCNEYFGGGYTLHEARHYWNPECWGNSMEGVSIERGLWIQKNNEKPIRVLPKGRKTIRKDYHDKEISIEIYIKDFDSPTGRIKIAKQLKMLAILLEEKANILLLKAEGLKEPKP